MILSTTQPYFFPYPGFFYKAYLSDILIIMDDVQFPQGTTWITRNRFKNDQGTHWITIPVWKKGLGLQKIKEVEICYEGRWQKKHLAGITCAYSNAPYMEDHIDFIEKVFFTGHKRLLDLNLTIIRYLNRYLRINTKLILLSDLDIDERGDRLLVAICRRLKTDQLLVQAPAKKYLDIRLYEEAGIHINCLKIPTPVYPQLWGEFIPNLSALDLVLNCGPKSRDILFDWQCIEVLKN
jgi:hypothetical protein